MNIISRYLLGEFAKTSLGVLLVLLLLMMGNTLVNLLHRAADGDIASSFIAPLLLLGLANYLVVFLGLAFYLGIIMAFGRLYKDQEMAALTACGARPWTFVRPLLLLSALVAALIAALTLVIVPRLITMQYSYTQQAEQKNLDNILKVGEFTQLGNTVIYVGSKMGENSFANIFVASFAPDMTLYQLAQSAKFWQYSGSVRADLYNGNLYRHSDDGITKIDYRHYQNKIETPPLGDLSQRVEGRDSMDLWWDKSPRAQAEWQWRVSLPIAAVLLLLLAFPISHTSVRKGAQAKLAAGVLIYLVYSNLLSYAKSLVQNQDLGAHIGMWWAHLPMLILLIWIYGARANFWQLCWLKMRGK